MRNFVSFANATNSSNKKWKCSDVRPRIFPRRTCREKALPVARKLTSDGIPAQGPCRVLKLARQPYYRWPAAQSLNETLRRRIERTRSTTPTWKALTSGTGSSQTKRRLAVNRYATGLRGGFVVSSVREEESPREWQKAWPTRA
jgi:hypothetical protein